MNEFYDISKEKKVLESTPQLENLGNQRIMISIGTTSRSGWNKRESSFSDFYTDVTAKDYDELFASKISRIDPHYEIDNFLDHHYQQYVKNFPMNSRKFLRHMEYVVIPILKRNDQTVCIDLMNEWLEEKNKMQSQLDKSTIKQSNNNSIIQSAKDSHIAKNIVDRDISETKTNKMEKIFISYSWDNKEHEERVGAFTEHLRKNGFDAQIDKMLSQKETATNFVKLMHKGMQYPKVIVVLSKGYKEKADQFTGGVGEEYEILINDIKTNPRKYILVSFDGRSSDIIPFGMQGREIIDLFSEESDDKLFRKLMDIDQYVFSDVAAEKPKLAPKQFGNFRENTSIDELDINIETPLVTWHNSQALGGVYISATFSFMPAFKNISSKSIDSLNYEIKLKQELIPEIYGKQDKDGYTLIRGKIEGKIFPTQIVYVEEIEVKIEARALNRILESHISIKAFTDKGPIETTFPIKELFKLSPINKPYVLPGPLSKDLFQN